MNVFFLEHFYEQDDEDLIRRIGVFSSYEKALSVLEKFKKKDGFKNYPDCFNIDKYEVNSDACWVDGFITVEEAMEELRKQGVLDE